MIELSKAWDTEIAVTETADQMASALSALLASQVEEDEPTVRLAA